MSENKKTIALAGSGFSSAVLARELVESGRYRAIIFEERSHIAGNCHSSRDLETQILVHHYGPHIFNTSREDVWTYVNRWSKFHAFTNRVKAVTSKGVFSLPINLLTINQFFGKKFTPEQAKDFVTSLGDSKINEPKNFEEQALKFLGRELYDAFFYGYTKKQWGVEPSELPASILKRLPVRFTYDDNYYDQRFQGIPVEGYTALIAKILDHPEIQVHLNSPFTSDLKNDFDHVFFSGTMDSYFKFKLGRMQYRSLIFKKSRAKGDFLGNPVINFCEENIPHTRITEHKHFAASESHSDTLYFHEFSKRAEGSDIPYYPMRLASDKALLNDYVKLADVEDKVTFIGRLGTYRYLDMHIVIGESLDLAKICLREGDRSRWPKFSQRPEREVTTGREVPK